MKTFSVVLLCIFLFAQTQAQIPGENPVVKSVSKLQTLPNGKNIFFESCQLQHQCEMDDQRKGGGIICHQGG